MPNPILRFTDKPLDWGPGPPGYMAVSDYGVILYVSMPVGDKDQTRPLIFDKGGVVAAVYRIDGYLAVNRIWRPVRKPGAGRVTLPITDPQGVLDTLGWVSLEFLRGYAWQPEAASMTGLHNAEQRVGLQPGEVISTIMVGDAFANGFNPNANDYIVVEVDPQAALAVPEAARVRDLIEGAEWMPEDAVWAAVVNGDIRDQQTLAALAFFEAWKRARTPSSSR